jgi:hypothetical protein
MLSLIGHKFGSLPYQLTVGMIVCQAQKAKSLEIIITLLSDHKAEFINSYNF